MVPRILLLTNTPAPYRLPIFAKLAEQVDLTVVFTRTNDPARVWETDLDASNFIYKFLNQRQIRFGSLTLSYNPDLKKLLIKPWDAVIFGENRQMMLSGMQVLRGLGTTPLIVWTGTTPGEDAMSKAGWLQKGYAAYRRRLYQRANAFIAYGEITRAHLESMGVQAEKIFSGTQIVPPEEIPEPVSLPELEPFKNTTNILSVNYLVKRKGLDVLIRAFMKAAGDNDRLILVGSGSEERSLKDLAGNDPRITFPGYKTGSEKSAYYAVADLFVFPTRHDPWGLVVNEAMAFGLPIIASEAAGCAVELVKDNGIVVTSEDVDAWTFSLEKLLRSPDERKRMGNRSAEIIKPYTVEKAVDTFISAFAKALG